jgi:hypothetical protein
MMQHLPMMTRCRLPHHRSEHASPTSFHKDSTVKASLLKRYLTPMRFRRNQEEIFKLHARRRRALCQSNALALSEEERSRVPQLHAREMDADARPCARAEGMESCFGGGRERFGSVAVFGRDPALGIEAGLLLEGRG